MILTLIQGAALILSVACATLTLRTALRSRHDHLRARNAAIGTLIAMANAVVLGLDLLDREDGSGWDGTLRLIPQVALPLTILLLLRAARRQDVLARAVARDSTFNHATSLPNYSLLLRQITPALARSRREATPTAMLVAGIDGFAAIVERRGPHQAGEILRSLATILGEATRAGDLSGHVEADLLGTLLPAATPEDAERVANRLRAVASERLVDPEMSGQRVTVSIGIAVVGEGAEPAALEEAISAAQAAYRVALAAGGNCARVAPSPPARSAGLSVQLGV